MSSWYYFLSVLFVCTFVFFILLIERVLGFV